MSLKTTRKTVANGLKLYLSNTSIHGFRYAVETPQLHLKTFWVFSIIFAFSSCFMYISDFLGDLRENPTITTNEEFPLDDFPAPAISVLVPQTGYPVGTRYRMANSIRACDPQVNISESPILKPYLQFTKYINDYVRQEYQPNGTDVEQHANIIRENGGDELFKRFCQVLHGLGPIGKESFLKALIDRIDSYLLVTDFQGMIGDLLPKIMKNEAMLEECEIISTNLSMEALRDWLVIKAPAVFKAKHGLACKTR